VAPEDLVVLSQVVADAFVEDPVMVWLLPDESNRRDQTLRWWTPVVARYLAAGRGWVTEDQRACLLWRHSGEILPPVPGQPRMPDLIPELVGADRFDTVTAALAVFADIRSTDEHVYVHVVAAAPDAQGAGHGSRLLAALADSDSGSKLICLESTNPRNHSFYLRNGFTLGASQVLPGSNVTATAFARRPTSAECS
jgi:ribosomal protein S18 acetylase RimI-like enzyme